MEPTLSSDRADLAGENSSSPQKIWRVGTLSYSFRGLVVLFSWLLWGDFAYSLRDRVVPRVIQLVFKKFGASDVLSGFLFSSLPYLLSVFVGPVVGYISDRLRTRWGRRIPFLFFLTPFIVLSVFGLAFCAPLGEALHRLLGSHSPGLDNSRLILGGIFWAIFGTACLTANGVFSALVNDVVPEKVVGRCFGVLRAGGLLVAILFNYYLFGKAEAHYPLLFVAVGLVYGIGFTIMCFNVKEGTYPPLANDPGGKSALAAMQTYFKDGFGHPYYLWFFAANILVSLVSVPFDVFSLFYAQSLSMNMTAWGACMALTYFCSLVLSYPLGWLADRFHPLRVTLLGLALYASAMAYGFFFAHDNSSFAVALVAHGIVTGSLWTMSMSLSQRLLPRAKFAEIGSAGSIPQNLIGVVVAPAMGIFLDYAHHQYRYTFLAGLVLTALAIGAFLVLYRKFVALGGPDHYVAPE